MAFMLNGVMGMLPMVLLLSQGMGLGRGLPGNTPRVGIQAGGGPLGGLSHIPRQSLRGLLGDIAPYLPQAEAGQVGRMVQIMDIGEQIDGVRRGNVTALAAPQQVDPMKRSVGILSALKRNIPQLGDLPAINQLEQITTTMEMLQGFQSMGGLGGIANAAKALSGLPGGLGATGQNQPAPNTGGLAGLFADTESQPPTEPAQGGGPSLGNIAEQVNRALSGMDEAQRRQLLNMAKTFAQNLPG